MLSTILIIDHGISILFDRFELDKRKETLHFVTHIPNIRFDDPYKNN